MIANLEEKMMALARITIPSILLFCLSNSACADDLKAFLSKMTDVQNYPFHLLDDSYRAFIRAGDINMSINKAELKEMHEEQNRLSKDLKITNLKILSRSDSENYTTATYQYEWSAKVGNTNMTGFLENHTTLLKKGESWIVIFDAVSQ